MKRLLILPVLLLSACNTNDFRKADVALRDFSVALVSVQSAFETSCAARDGAGNPVVDAQTCLAMERFEREAAQDGNLAVTAIRNLKSKPKALDAIDAALSAVDQMNVSGALHIKDPATKASIAALVLSLRGVLVTAKALLS